MSVLAFDGRMGAAGDMILGALLAAGADPTVLAPVEEALGVTYAVEETTKNGVRATRIDVLLEGEAAETASVQPGQLHDRRDGENDDVSTRIDNRHDSELKHDDQGGPEDNNRHSHDGSRHSNEHHDDDLRNSREHQDDGHDSARRDRGPAEGAGPHRSYPEVVEVVEEMDLPESVASDARSIFELLGEAEASVHGTELRATHFHEVGADDAIADVVGAALLLDDLDPDRVMTAPVSAGGGEVEMSHGRYPVPTPAVVEIAERADWSLRGGPVETELLTPTGAAILAHVAEGIETLPSLRIRSSGYGAGDHDFPEHPNVLRAMVGDVRGSGGSSNQSEVHDSDAGGGELRRESIRILETNVDDVSPEVLGGLQETLAEAGARDVSIVPLTMKKSRPGHLVKVTVRPEDATRVARRLAEETGTLGVRETGASHRWVAEREVRSVSVEIDGETYEVGVKVAADTAGAIYDVSAEYDDAAGVAREVGVPVREVMRLAEATVRE